MGARESRALPRRVCVSCHVSVQGDAAVESRLYYNHSEASPAGRVVYSEPELIPTLLSFAGERQARLWSASLDRLLLADCRNSSPRFGQSRNARNPAETGISRPISRQQGCS